MAQRSRRREPRYIDTVFDESLEPRYIDAVKGSGVFALKDIPPGSMDGHAIGWQAVNNTCIKAGLDNPALLTATKMRHRASTVFALQDVPKKNRDAFYKHMGHSQAINETVYQCPPSVLEICKVGRFLQELDCGLLTGKALADSRIIAHEAINNDNISTEVDEISIEQGEKSFEQNEISNEQDELSTGQGKISTEHNMTQEILRGFKTAENTKRRTLVKWSAEDETILYSYFQKCIEDEVCSGRREVTKLQQLHPSFALRHWKVIKAKIFNRINRCKRRLSKHLTNLTE